ncbi:hypothetical protein H5T56_02225 [Candidatus Bipolaricaulota bacterium]|nr:hypothetical protein [Candidatus Bipolaricaulota bacterium]
MYTVRELVSILSLATENQVRNRIEAIRDLLLPHLRRGPNNQLLLTEEGLRLLRDLQALCETGHTLKEAANILRFRFEEQLEKPNRVSEQTEENREKQEKGGEEGWRALVEHLAAEVRDLAERVRVLEAKLQGERGQAAWWERWRDLKIS